MNVRFKRQGGPWSTSPVSSEQSGTVKALLEAVGAATGDVVPYWRDGSGRVVELTEANLQEFLHRKLVAVPRGAPAPSAAVFSPPPFRPSNSRPRPASTTAASGSTKAVGASSDTVTPPKRSGGKKPKPKPLPPPAVLPPHLARTVSPVASAPALRKPRPQQPPQRRLRAGSKTTDDIPSRAAVRGRGTRRGRGMPGRLGPGLTKPHGCANMAGALILPAIPATGLRGRPRAKSRVQIDTAVMDEQVAMFAQGAGSRKRGLTTRINYRNECLKEIFNTERDYLADLDVLLGVFKIPLELMQMVPADEVDGIFSNAASLQTCNKGFFEKLSGVMDDSEADKSIGSCFTSMAGEFLENYKVYCANQKVSLATLERLKKRNQQFDRYLTVCHTDPKCRGLRITDFLIKPVQRICKYPLLLRELVKHTKQDHPDFKSISEASSEIEAVVNNLNEWQRKEQMQRTARDLERRFGPSCPRLAENQLIREGILTFHKSVTSKGSNTYVYLFSEYFLVTARGGNELRFSIPLASCKLVVFADSEDLENAFEVKSSMGKVAGIFSTHSKVDKQGWNKDIKTQIKLYQKQAFMRMNKK